MGVDKHYRKEIQKVPLIFEDTFLRPRTIQMFDTYKSIKNLEKEGKFTEKAAASIVKVIAGSIEQNLSELATKQDIAMVKQDIAMLRNETKQDIAMLRNETKQDIAMLQQDIAMLRNETKQDIELLKAEINANMAQMYVNIIKWFIGMFITMGGAFTTAMYYMIKYMPSIQQVIQTQ